mgnify:CR=1 FL=1
MKLIVTFWDQEDNKSNLIIHNKDTQKEVSLEVSPNNGELIFQNNCRLKFTVSRKRLFSDISGANVNSSKGFLFGFSCHLFPRLILPGDVCLGKLKIKSFIGTTSLYCDNMNMSIKHNPFKSPCAIGEFGNAFSLKQDSAYVLFGFLLNEFGNFESSVA